MPNIHQAPPRVIEAGLSSPSTSSSTISACPYLADMTPGKLKLADAVRGDTISAKRFTVTKTTEAGTTPLDLTGCQITSTFRIGYKKKVKEIGKGITITDAVAGVFDLDSFSLDEVGTYSFDIQFIFPNGEIKTYVFGSVKILKDVTI